MNKISLFVQRQASGGSIKPEKTQKRIKTHKNADVENLVGQGTRQVDTVNPR